MVQMDTTNIREELENIGFIPFDGEYGLTLINNSEEGVAFDYYGEFFPPSWINPKLNAIAEKYDCFWEWAHPSAIVLAE